MVLDHLRTSGVHFIMITLAFSQMIYFLCESLNQFGGDNGLNIPDHSSFGGLIDLDDAVTLYYLAFGCLLMCLWFGSRLVESRFGIVVRGAKSNDRRMAALGFSTFRYRLTAFVLAGAMGGLAGVLLAQAGHLTQPLIGRGLVAAEDVAENRATDAAAARRAAQHAAEHILDVESGMLA